MPARPSLPRSSPLAPAVLALVAVAAGAFALVACGPEGPGPEDCCPCVGEVRTGCEDVCSESGACSEVDA